MCGKQVKRHFQCGDDPSMIREWSEHENANRNPPRKWGYFSRSPGAFSIVKYNVSSPILHSNIHHASAAPATRSNTWPSPNTAPTTTSTTWPSPNTAPTTKSNTWPWPSTAPATKSNTHSLSSWHMKPHLQCAEQSMSPYKLTKYCACHAKWPLNVWQKCAENRWNVISNAGTIRAWSEHDPRMIRAWKRKPQPASQVRLLFKVPRSIFYCKIQRFEPNLTFKHSPSAAPATKSNTWPSPNTAPTTTSIPLDLHRILPLPRKVTRIVHPRDIWSVIYNARSNQCLPTNSPHTAPATQNDHLTCGRNVRKTSETSFPMRGRSEHDPSMIREWSEHENANRNPPRKWGYFSRSPGAFSIVKYNVSSPILHSNIHQVLRLPQKVTLDLHGILPLPRQVTLDLHQVLRLPQKVPLDLHRILPLPRKVTRIVHPRDIWSLIYNARSNQCLPTNSPNTAPATQNDHLTCGRNVRKTGETSFPMRGRSEHDPSMIREWSEHENANRNPPRKWGYFSRSPATKSNTWPSPNTAPTTTSTTWPSPNTAHATQGNTWPSPNTAPTTTSNTWPSPNTAPTTKVTLELFQILPLPRKVTLDLHQVLHLPRKVTFELTLLYLTLLYLILLYLTLLYLTLLYLTLLYLTLLYLTLLYLTLLYLTLLYLTLLYLTLLYLTLLYLTLLYLTLLYLTLLYLTRLYLTLLYLTLLYWTLLYLFLLYLTLL